LEPLISRDVDMVSDAVRETHTKMKKSIEILVGSRMTAASVARSEALLDLVEQFSIENPTINFHIHMSGDDHSGMVSWVPIFEHQVVLESPAKRVLNMIHRYIESANRLISGSTAFMKKKNWRATDKSRCRDRSGSQGSPTAASNLTDFRKKPTTEAPSTGGAAPLESTPSTLSDGLGGAGGDKMGIDNGGTDREKGNDDSPTKLDDEVPLEAALAGDRNRQSARTCPQAATAAVPVISSGVTKNVVMKFLTGSSKPLTLMRDLVSSMAKSVCHGASVPIIRVSRHWWPKTDKGKLCQRTDRVENKLLRAADKAKGPTDGEMTVYLKRILTTRSAPALDRVAVRLLMVEREPKAKATLIKLNFWLQKTQLRRAVSIARLSNINIAGDVPSSQVWASKPTGQGQTAAPNGQGPPAASTGQRQPSAPTDQGQTAAPAPAQVSLRHAAGPSLAAAAAASRTQRVSDTRVGYGRHTASLPRKRRTTAPAFNHTRMHEAVAAAKAAFQEESAPQFAATRTAAVATAAARTAAARKKVAETAPAAKAAEKTATEKTAGGKKRSEKPTAATKLINTKVEG